MENASLKEQINKLVALQAVDTQIYNLEMEKNSLPEVIKKLDDAFEEKKQHLAGLEKDLIDLQKQKKEKELDLGSKEDGIKKNQTQLYQLKTNKEYSAMLKEIDGIKADISVIEDGILGIMEKADAAKEDIAGEKDVLKAEEGKLNAQKNKIQGRVKEIDDRLAQLKAERSRATEGIDDKLMSQYDRIMKGRDWLAIVPVRDDACQGCFMNVPPQVINLIKMYDRLVVCEACQRILYIDDNGPA